ncbi:DUF445 family protein [Sulfitobacter sp. JBTF-M27]|uniref:DUF445 family protein n=1 Tax=Sulfitobacter sediminilitoris TaxID=2698830 RepID=A0A6P0CFH9_9RHOB|nr:DUF445 family protein [Sulfitobacter sediminilitoris]NEK23233.1 DUF445 family protein [Sulfitobacter sediminilitoris]
MRDLEGQEIERLAALQRIKMLATLVLLGCFLLLILTKVLEAQFPSLAIVAAFAEAATIGGIADWYAVVAIFKRPLNLPFPHTAIIPNNQHRIADNLGGFIENNFLARAPVQQKLREIDFAGEMSHWLASPSRSQSLARFIVRLVPQLLASVDEKGLVRFASDRVTGQLARTDIAPLVGDVMTSFTKEGRHQKLLDEVITAMHRFLNNSDTLDVIRGKVQKELPLFFNILQGDRLVLNRLVHAATELLNEIKADKEHPLREEFESFLKDYIRRTKRTKTFAKRVETLKQQLLARKELSQAAESIWENLRRYVMEDVEKEDSVLVARMTDLFVDIGTTLESEPDLRRDINEGMITVLSNLIEEQRGNISLYVAEQVKSWDIQQLLTLIEVNVGRDLQYIRFNGMIIGGFVGVALFLVESLLLP